MSYLQTAAGVAPWPAVEPQAGDPQPLSPGGRIGQIVATLISAAVLVAAVASLRTLDVHAVEGLLPRAPLFWLVFTVSYLAAPAADWIIFRRLWRIPVEGIVPLLRKMIGNELLLGYVGELYFYTWARRRADITTAPFGAIKDVTVLSALVGNAVTLAMLAVAAPVYRLLPLGTWGRPLLYSMGIILVSSLAAFVWRKRLFSLPRPDLRFITAVHLARVVAITGLTAVAWHLVLPAVGLSWWVVLATLRLLISRLPLIANKDVVFAAIAVVLVGHDVEIGDLMAMMASLVLATHVTLGIILTVAELVRRDAVA